MRLRKDCSLSPNEFLNKGTYSRRNRRTVRFRRKGVSSADEALKGPGILSLNASFENGEARSRIRLLLEGRGRIKSAVSRGKEEEGTNFEDYFNWEEPAAPAPSHRILAMFRGEKEKFLSLSIFPKKKL